MGNITFEKTGIPGVIVLTPRIFSDERGYFMEVYQQRELLEGGIRDCFVQENQSLSSKGVLRGMHYQREHPQSKLIRVLSGSIYDVAIDLRTDSPTHNQWFGIVLSSDNQKMLYIPRGFAHGFLALEDNSLITYKADDFYCPQCDAGVKYDNPAYSVNWPVLDVPYLVSAKDLAFE